MCIVVGDYTPRQKQLGGIDSTATTAGHERSFQGREYIFAGPPQGYRRLKAMAIASHRLVRKFRPLASKVHEGPVIEHAWSKKTLPKMAKAGVTLLRGRSGTVKDAKRRAGCGMGAQSGCKANESTLAGPDPRTVDRRRYVGSRRDRCRGPHQWRDTPPCPTTRSSVCRMGCKAALGDCA